MFNQEIYDYEHKEGKGEYNKKYYQEHKEKRREEKRMKDRKYASKHKKEIRAYQKKYYSNPKHREERRVYLKRQFREYGKSPQILYSSCKAKAKYRSYAFNLTYEQFLTFWQKPCFYCGNSVETVGLDRIENRYGYSMDNVISCCKWCNWIKKDCSQMEFVKHCKKIVDNCIEILG